MIPTPHDRGTRRSGLVVVAFEGQLLRCPLPALLSWRAHGHGKLRLCSHQPARLSAQVAEMAGAVGESQDGCRWPLVCSA